MAFHALADKGKSSIPFQPKSLYGSKNVSVPGFPPDAAGNDLTGELLQGVFVFGVPLSDFQVAGADRFAGNFVAGLTVVFSNQCFSSTQHCTCVRAPVSHSYGYFVVTIFGSDGPGVGKFVAVDMAGTIGVEADGKRRFTQTILCE